MVIGEQRKSLKVPSLVKKTRLGELDSVFLCRFINYMKNMIT